MKNKLFKRVVLLISTLLFILVLFLLPSTSCEKLDEHFNSTDDIDSTDSEACEHNFSKWNKTSIATCVREGKRIRICSKCEMVETEIIEIQPHDGKLCRIVKPTCYDEGYSVYLCDCGYIYNSNYISALGHTLIKEQTVEKTCTTQGYTHYRCELCDYGITEDIVPPSHDFKVTVVRPTATASGFTKHDCEDCAYRYDNTFISYKDILPSPYLQSSVPLCKGIDIYEGEHETSNGTYLPIDWKSIKAQGYDFVILKIGSRKSGKSPTFDMDYEGAKAAGLGVGAYYYAYSSTVADTLEDARNVLKWVEGKQFEYPIYFDIEDESLKTVSRGTLTKIITAFIEELQSNGYYSAIYVNNEWLVEILDTNTILDRFDVWYARYPLTDNPTWNEQKYGKQLSMWQFTDKGRVNGLSDDIDVNYCYRDYPTLMKRWGLNGFEKHPVLG